MSVNDSLTFTIQRYRAYTRKMRVLWRAIANRAIDRLPAKAQYRIDALTQLPLEPLEYCQRWVELSPDERGYRKACVEVLAVATGLSPRTIENWGKHFEKRPDHVTHTLRLADTLNQIRKIILPPDYPQT